ncbi:MAG: hypothetical protein NVS9B10_04890 [Nevskia sp.]
MMRQLALFAASAAVSLAASAVDLYVPGSDNDPRLRATDYLAADHRYFSAASELLKIQGAQPEQRLPADFYRRLADDTLSFGMEERAEIIYRELLAANPDPVTLARGRIRAAEFEYQRGYQEQAVEDLLAMRERLPQQVVVDWQDTLARALMAQGRYNEAAEVLTDLDNSSRQSPYTRYNLGVALINDGRAGQGINVLDRVGRLSPRNDEELALRDKANLALGYHFLRQQQGGTAIGVFERIRSEGPLSNRALLGLGWAYLAPQGTKQTKTEIGDEVPNELNAFRSFSTIGVLLRPGFLDADIYKRAGLRPFRLSKTDQQQEAALKRALVPWVELIHRDPIDPAVQEGLLAIPFSLDRLGAHVQAQQFYEKAVRALEAGRKQIDATADYVRSGRMVDTMIKRTADAESGWTWELKDLPDAQETFYLQGLVAENRFQEQLKNYRDVQLMRRNLEAWTARIDELQAAWLKREAPAVEPAVLFAQGLQNAQATAANPAPAAQTLAPLKLQAAESLSAHDAAAPAHDAAAPVAAAPLQVAPSPPAARFDGTWERLQAMKTRIIALRPKLVAASDAQARLLEGIAQADLANQRRQTEKYLIEARFALARIYDRSLKGEAP